MEIVPFMDRYPVVVFSCFPTETLAGYCSVGADLGDPNVDHQKLLSKSLLLLPWKKAYFGGKSAFETDLTLVQFAL